MVLVAFTNGPSCICNVSAFAVAAPDAVLSKMHQPSQQPTRVLRPPRSKGGPSRTRNSKLAAPRVKGGGCRQAFLQMVLARRRPLRERLAARGRLARQHWRALHGPRPRLAPSRRASVSPDGAKIQQSRSSGLGKSAPACAHPGRPWSDYGRDDGFEPFS